MPVLNIQGQRIRVGDEFLSLSPEQQQATVDEIAGQLGIEGGKQARDLLAGSGSPPRAPRDLLAGQMAGSQQTPIFAPYQEGQAQAFSSGPDLGRIKGNVRKMRAQGAPERDIDSYIASEGVSLDDVRGFQDRPSSQSGQTIEQQRALALARARGRRAREGASSQLSAQAAVPLVQSQQAMQAGVGPGWAQLGMSPQMAGSEQSSPPNMGAAPQDSRDYSSAFYGTGAGAKGFVEGIPIAGPVMEKGVRAAAAGILAPFKDETFGQLYDRLGNIGQQAQEAHPYINTAGNVAGAVAGTIPMIAAAPGAFGVGSGSLLARSLVSAGTGGALGSTDAAVRSGGDLEAIKQGAAWGAAGGFAGPAAGELIGGGVRLARSGGNALADSLLGSSMVADTGLSRGATKVLSRAMEADRLTPQALQQRMADLGPAAMVADAGPNLQQTASALVTMPGEGRGIVQTAMRDREAGASARIRESMDANLGPAPIPSQVDEGLTASQRSLSPAYTSAFEDARAVDTRALADALDSAAVNERGSAQDAARSIRQMLNVTGTDQLDPNPRTLHAVREAVDGMMPDLRGNARRLVGDWRWQIDNELADKVPGIKEVDARFQELALQREGLERGQQVLRTGPQAIRPQELADELLASSQPQGTAIGPSAVPLRLRQGARADLDRIVGTNANDRAALQRLVNGEGDWNGEKLRQLFGADRANRMLGVLDAERTFADTNSFVTRNSATAARKEGVRALESVGDNGLGFGDSAVIGGPTGVLIKGAAKAADGAVKALSKVKNEKIRAQIAQALVGEDAAPMLQAITARTPRTLTPQQQLSREAIRRAILFAPGLYPVGR